MDFLALIILEQFKTCLSWKCFHVGAESRAVFPWEAQEAVFWQQAAKWQLKHCCNAQRNGEGPSAPAILHRKRALPKSFAWLWPFKTYFLDLLAFKKKRKKQTKPSLESASLISDSLVQINSEFWSYCVCTESIGIIALCWKPLETECWKD